MKRAFFLDLSQESGEFSWWRLWLATIAVVVIGFGLGFLFLWLLASAIEKVNI